MEKMKRPACVPAGKYILRIKIKYKNKSKLSHTWIYTMGSRIGTDTDLKVLLIAHFMWKKNYNEEIKQKVKDCSQF